jgi:hypothetical protein
VSGDLRFVGVSLDCADPAELAHFYVRLLGGRVLWSRPNSVGVQLPGLLLVPQRVAGYRPPVWPGASIVHLDFTADEQLAEPVKRAIELGARAWLIRSPMSDGRRSSIRPAIRSASRLWRRQRSCSQPELTAEGRRLYEVAP